MKTIATIVGCGIGDALGNPFEMHPFDSPELLVWDGLFKAGGTFWEGEAGEWTDDCLMSQALATSLIEKNTFEPEDVASKYLAWYISGNTRGIGTTTASSLHQLKVGYTWETCGLTNLYGKPVGGNGTAMRASPLGLFFRNDLPSLIKYAMQDASITHNSHEPKMGSIAVALGTALIANGVDKKMMLDEVINVLSDSEVKDRLVLARSLLAKNVPIPQATAQLGVSGYVVDTVASAFYCFCASSNFKDTVVSTVRAGGDTDSLASISGALAGTYYGLEGIPPEYKDNVEDFQVLQDLTEKLLHIKT